MNAFDPLLWAAIAYLVVRIASSGDERLWLPIGALAGITILNKYAILFWLSGLILGICLTPLRQSLRHRWFWFACVLATAIALPNFLWQWRHQFPFLQLMHNVRESGRDIVLPPLAYLLAQAQMLGFVAALLVPFALLFFSFKTRKTFPRTRLGLPRLPRGDDAPSRQNVLRRPRVPHHVRRRRGVAGEPQPGAVFGYGRSLRSPSRSSLSAGIYAPTILPILSVPDFLAYEHKMGIEQQKFEQMKPQGVLPQLYADMFGWAGDGAQRWRRTIALFLPKSKARLRSSRITTETPEPSTSSDRSTVSQNPSVATRTTGSGDHATTPARA
jgi:hypothetical protein